MPITSARLPMEVYRELTAKRQKFGGDLPGKNGSGRKVHRELHSALVSVFGRSMKAPILSARLRMKVCL